MHNRARWSLIDSQRSRPRRPSPHRPAWEGRASLQDAIRLAGGARPSGKPGTTASPPGAEIRYRSTGCSTPSMSWASQPQHCHTSQPRDRSHDIEYMTAYVTARPVQEDCRSGVT